MLFSSLKFIVYFLPVAFSVFYCIPRRCQVLRKLWLILASLFFYGYWRADYVPLLLLSIVGNYAFAELITRSASARRSKAILTLAVSLNLLCLGFFKYTNFAIGSLSHLFHRDLGHFDIVLPLAISFFTFTQISYLVDICRDRTLHYSFLDYSLFVVLFPHLIAGPIVRHWEIIPQFTRGELNGDRNDFGIGLTLFLIGLAKKALADSVAGYADSVYNGAATGATISSVDAWIGTVAFGIQIYFDFSAYSDMAIGLARLFGIVFPSNFDSPYRAPSIIVFWERWHRTLTRFLREYVYFILGGNRRGRLRQILNILTTMLLSGLWHGAAWTYVLWGGLHGVFLVLNHLWRVWTERMKWNLNHRMYRAAGILLTFFCVSLAWVFFRASNFTVAADMLSNMLALHGFSLPQQLAPQGGGGWHFVRVNSIAISNYQTAFATIASLLVFCWVLPNSQQVLEKYHPVLDQVDRPSSFHLTLDWKCGLPLGFCAYFIIKIHYTSGTSPFIYFNF